MQEAEDRRKRLKLLRAQAGEVEPPETQGRTSLLCPSRAHLSSACIQLGWSNLTQYSDCSGGATFNNPFGQGTQGNPAVGDQRHAAPFSFYRCSKTACL